MRRVLAAAIVLISALQLLFAPSIRAQALPSKPEAADWVRKAIEASYLDAPGASPFHLVAKIHYTVGEQVLDGSYEILWPRPIDIAWNYAWAASAKRTLFSATRNTSLAPRRR